MRVGRAAVCALSVGVAALLSACASVPANGSSGVSAGFSQISPAAAATAQKGPDGKLVEAKYADRTAMLRAADMAAFMKAAREEMVSAGDEKQPAIAIIVVADEVAAGRYKQAAQLVAAQQDTTQGVGAVLSAMTAAANGDKEAAKIALKLAKGSAPTRLSEIAELSILEVWGDYPAAAKVLDDAEANYVFRQATPGGPKNLEAFAAALATPDALDFALRSGAVHYRAGDMAEARRLYSLALALAPDEIDARESLARIKRGEKAPEAQLTIQQAMARVYGALADDFAKREAVSSVLGAALAGGPPAQDQFSPPVSIFTQTSLVLDPNNSRRQIGLASDFLRVNEVETSLRVAARVKDPRWTPTAKLLIAQAYLKQSKDNLAVAEANQALKAAPKDPLTLAQAGYILSQAGQDAPAIDALTNAANLSTASEMKVAATFTRAAVHFKFGRVPMAISDVRQAAKAAPAREDIQATLATYLIEGDATYSEGLSILRRMLAASPDDAERMNALGYTLLSRSNTLEEGYRLLAKANAASPYDWAIVDSIGWAYYLYGDYPAAIEHLQAAAAGFGDEPNPEVLDHLGDALWRSGKKEDAKASWKKALDARPHAALSARVQAKLAGGLTTPAPKKRKPPFVDVSPPKPASPT